MKMWASNNENKEQSWVQYHKKPQAYGPQIHQHGN